MRDKTTPFHYLLECSQMSLEDFELARLDRAASLRKQLRDIAEEWVEAEVEAQLARWVRENRVAPSRELQNSASTKTSWRGGPAPSPLRPASPTRSGLRSRRNFPLQFLYRRAPALPARPRVRHSRLRPEKSAIRAPMLLPPCATSAGSSNLISSTPHRARRLAAGRSKKFVSVKRSDFSTATNIFADDSFIPLSARSTAVDLRTSRSRLSRAVSALNLIAPHCPRPQRSAVPRTTRHPAVSKPASSSQSSVTVADNTQDDPLSS